MTEEQKQAIKNQKIDGINQQILRLYVQRLESLPTKKRDQVYSAMWDAAKAKLEELKT